MDDDTEHGETDEQMLARFAANRLVEHKLRLEIQQAQAHAQGRLGNTSCNTCGLFGRKGVAGSTVIEEVSLLGRVEGDVWSMRTEKRPAIPWCIVAAYPLKSEVDLKFAEFMAQPDKARYGVDYVQQTAASMVIAAERECENDWIVYLEGEAPPEARTRREMMRIREQEAAREQQWQEFQANLAKQLHDDGKAFDLQLHQQAQRLDRRLYIAGLFAIVLAVAAIAATLYPLEMRAGIDSVIAWLRGGG